MTKMAGYKIVLQFDTKVLVGYRRHSMDAEADIADATTGDSTDQWKENLPLFKGMEFSVEGLYDPTEGTGTGFDSVFALLAAGTKFVAKYGGIENGDTYWSVDAYIRRVHHGADYTDLAEVSIDCIATGKPTKGAVGSS